MKCDNCLAGKHRDCTKPTWNQYRNYTQCRDGIAIRRDPP